MFLHLNLMLRRLAKFAALVDYLVLALWFLCLFLFFAVLQIVMQCFEH